MGPEDASKFSPDSPPDFLARKSRSELPEVHREKVCSLYLPSGAPGLHALQNYFGINFRFDYTYTSSFIVLGINYKSVIGALWDYTCTPEITLTL